ncbi:PTS sugar transporter subunit IIB [Brevibacillus choshinensis]|uniref:PTS sugar transporter subunit IIB n=1 Tax=Brevibacillus choshinensis TaxID=54911 RepID=A0ABX7FWD3_BRECH|nr:PTS sugar transporter subunit IIB [Brevibacillus choshinensis]QRG70220.1 PTS sugar transporter subunit IIB [Brevibacillus choshinensis]
MNKKKVLVICGTGVATSTVVMQKLKAFLRDKGIDASLDQSKVIDLLNKAEQYDLIISTTAVPPSLAGKVINAVPLLTGIGKEQVYDEIEAKLKV